MVEYQPQRTFVVLRDMFVHLREMFGRRCLRVYLGQLLCLWVVGLRQVLLKLLGESRTLFGCEQGIHLFGSQTREILVRHEIALLFSGICCRLHARVMIALRSGW